MLGEKRAKLDVLDGLIKYMRKLELGKEDPEDALASGLDSVESDMEENDIDEPEMEIDIEEDPKEDDDAEISPFQKEMRDYFNDRDRPKIGSSVSFMVESKKPSMKSSSNRMDDMDEKMDKRGRGRPRKG